MKDEEKVTMKNLKDKLYEWKCSKSIELAYNICSALCDHFGIVRGGDSNIKL